MSQEYDFIIIGGGAAGCLLASRLANTPSKPTVALLEGGPNIAKKEYRRAWNRFTTLAENPNLDYLYKTTPQPELNDREIPVGRGKGLGGSTAVNFQFWLLAAKPELDAWESKLGTKDWGFDEIVKRVKQLENLHVDASVEKWGEYYKPDPNYHGYGGPLDVSVGPIEEETMFLLDAWRDLGVKSKLDQNDGDPIGVSLAPLSNYKNVTTTASSAFLEKGYPSNLTVLTDTRIVKILFEGKRAVGVQQEDGTKLLAKKEVVLSAGALDSPRLLLLSGVGPRADLEALGIDVVKDLDGVGKGLTDHVVLLLWYEADKGLTKRRRTTDNLAPALEEYDTHGTGPLTELNTTMPVAFLPNKAALESPEFQALSKETQEFLLKPEVPSFEAITCSLPLRGHQLQNPSSNFCTFGVGTMNPLSRGELKLASADPSVPALMNPNFLAHPYDAVSLRESVRVLMNLVKTPSLKGTLKPVLTPKSDSDEDITAYYKDMATSMFHPSCTVQMGRSEEDGSCLNTDLKVHGLDGLRVVDFSVTPTLPSGHPQILTYAIAQIASEKMTKEYGL